MAPVDLTHYLADQPPSVVRLEIEKHFDALNDQQKRYAHFISKCVPPSTRLSSAPASVLLTAPRPGPPLRAPGSTCASCRQSRSPFMT